MARAKRSKNEFAQGLAPADGDFYSPRLASDARTGTVPGVPDGYRRAFLKRASDLEPELLATLTSISPEDSYAISKWAERWRLTDPWCLALAKDTIRWHRTDPAAQGWEFEGTSIFVGHFAFKIPPLRIKESFYHDPTWRRRREFKEYVIGQVAERVDEYCDQIEADALKAGLKRVKRKNEASHFDWLVRYHIRGESFASIAQDSPYKYQAGRQTVRKAVVELAKIIALTLKSST